MSLEHRFDSLAARIQLLEQQLGLSDSSISHAGFRRWQELQLLQQRQLHRIGTCEDRLTLQLAVPQKVERVVTESASIMSPDQRRATAAQESTQTRLSLELTERGITSYRFRRAPADYYEQSLEYRKQVLGAESTSQLCKSLVLENTRARSAAADAQHAARYFCVVIQVYNNSHILNRKLPQSLRLHICCWVRITGIRRQAGLQLSAVAPRKHTQDHQLLLSCTSLCFPVC